MAFRVATLVFLVFPQNVEKSARDTIPPVQKRGHPRPLWRPKVAHAGDSGRGE